MAGRRHDGDQTVAPLRVLRHARRRRFMAAKLAAARTARERLQIASDYLRGAVARRHPDPEHAERLLDEHTERTVALADHLLEQQAAEPLRAQRETS